MGRFKKWLRSARGKTFLAATAIGAVGLGAGIPLWNTLDAAHLGVFWFELCAAVFILGGVEILIRAVEAWMESRDERDFRRFFGDGVITKGMLAVFPTAEPPEDEGGFCNIVYPNPPRRALEMKGKAKGIKHVVPYEDLRAVLALSGLFQRMRAELTMALDVAFQVGLGADQPVIGIGLGFNHVTSRLGAICPDLYSITFESGTDDFLFERREHGFPKERLDCALVARVVSHNGGPPRFVCAGRSAAGTQAAGVYLATHWKSLLSYYEREGRELGEDSLGVLLKFPDEAPDEAEAERHCFSPWAKRSKAATVEQRVVPEEDEEEQVSGI